MCSSDLKKEKKKKIVHSTPSLSLLGVGVKQTKELYSVSPVFDNKRLL